MSTTVLEAAARAALGAVIILAATALLARYAPRLVAKRLVRARLSQNIEALTLRAITVGIVVLGGSIALAPFGFGLAPFFSAAALTFLLGSWFSSIAEAVAAGDYLLAEQQITLGDVISLDARGIMGEVTAIPPRVTVLRDRNGDRVLVPNSIMFSEPVRVLAPAQKVAWQVPETTAPLAPSPSKTTL